LNYSCHFSLDTAANETNWDLGPNSKLVLSLSFVEFAFQVDTDLHLNMQLHIRSLTLYFVQTCLPLLAQSV
jgi:hypothetical protein